MPRPRNPENMNLPKRWQFHHEAYFYQVPPGMEKYWNHKRKFRLGETLEEAKQTFELMLAKSKEVATVDPDLLDTTSIVGSSFFLHREGVYFLIDGGEIVYVGRSDNIADRIGAHVAAKRMVFDRVLTVPANGLDQERLEQRYIAAFTPKYNVYGVAYNLD